MSSGFRFVLAGACAVALLFVALSLWRYLPQLDVSLRPPQTGNAQPPAPSPPYQAPHTFIATPAPAAGATPPASSSAAAPPAAPAGQQQVTLHSPAAGAEQALHDPDAGVPDRWLLTTANAIVRKRPGGDPLVALSVSKAPLTVLSGCYLREVRREGDWVLILSPSRTLGWVSQRQVKGVD
jgi:hypothetical protein